MKQSTTTLVYITRGYITRKSITGTCLLAVLGVALSGCGISSLTSGLSGGVFSGKSKAKEVRSVTAESMLSAAKAQGGNALTGSIAGGCPHFVVWPRDNELTIYEPGKAGDGLAIMHRGEITKTARECSIEPGRITVKYGFSGRVLLGPRGQAGTVRLPLNVFVTDAKRERIKSDVMSVEVPVAIEKPIGYFSTVRTVTFNIAEGTRPADYKIFVGFDRKAPGAG